MGAVRYELTPGGVLEYEAAGWTEPAEVFARLRTEGAAVVWSDPVAADGFIGLAQEDSDLLMLERSATAPTRGGPHDELSQSLQSRLGDMGASSQWLGWWGWLSYELGLRLQDLDAPDDELPLAAFAFVDRGIVFDRARHRMTLIVLATAHDATAWLLATAHRLSGSAPPAAARVRLDTPIRWRWRHDRAAYLERIDACMGAIRDGDAYQLCLTNEVRVATDPLDDPLACFERLRSMTRTSHGGVLRIGDRWLLSASPEQYLAVDVHGTARTRPMKGTAARFADAARDAASSEALVGNDKERAENLMIVDLMRNDLSRVSAVGSVRVTDLFGVETTSYTHQLVSTIESTLAVHPVDAMLSMFPAGSMTGAPKRSAMRLLTELEAGPRGVYSGVWGRISLDGSVDLAVVIRSVVAGRGWARFGSGGGITAMSDPASEWSEVELKARPMLMAIGADFG